MTARMLSRRYKCISASISIVACKSSYLEWALVSSGETDYTVLTVMTKSNDMSSQLFLPHNNNSYASLGICCFINKQQHIAVTPVILTVIAKVTDNINSLRIFSLCFRLCNDVALSCIRQTRLSDSIFFPSLREKHCCNSQLLQLLCH